MAGQASTVRRFLARMLLAGASLVCALVLAEVVVRLAAPQNIRPTFQTPDTRVKYRLRPDAQWTMRGRTGEYDAAAHTNSAGWRSAELDGRRRIMVLGDSFTFGFGVGQEQTWPALLERHLVDAGYDYQVVNLGTEGRSPDQYWADYHFDKDRVDPVMVVIGFFERNDFIDESPIIRCDADALRLVPTESTGPYGFLRAVLQGPAYDVLAQHSHASVLFKNALYGLTRRDESDGSRRVPTGIEGIDEVHPDPAAIEFTRRIMQGLVREVRSDGLPVFVFAIPAPGELYPATSGLLEDLAAAGARVEALRPHFAGDPAQYYFQRDDRHWNPHGHRLAAERIAATILGDSLLQSAHAGD